jgi:glycolate oxidase FAD binding subunit
MIPTSEEEAAELVRAHARVGVPLAISGGDTRSGFGNAVAASARLRSTGLTGIVSYNPGEMVMTARAGTPLAEVEAALTENGQMLAFEPMDHRPLMGTSGEPTIGGVFASNVSGPRRLVAGAARDSLLGVRFVNGRGEIVKAGGRVM